MADKIVWIKKDGDPPSPENVAQRLIQRMGWELANYEAKHRRWLWTIPETAEGITELVMFHEFDPCHRWDDFGMVVENMEHNRGLMMSLEIAGRLMHKCTEDCMDHPHRVIGWQRQEEGEKKLAHFNLFQACRSAVGTMRQQDLSYCNPCMDSQHADCEADSCGCMKCFPAMYCVVCDEQMDPPDYDYCKACEEVEEE